MYNCFDIAKKIIELSKKDNVSIDPMKLLKLVYIALWCFSEKPLIINKVEAWKYGPVIPEL